MYMIGKLKRAVNLGCMDLKNPESYFCVEPCASHLDCFECI